MKSPFLTLILVAAALVAGFVLSPLLRTTHDHAAESASTQSSQKWTCSMHPQVIRDAPGNCPICGMALEPLREDGQSHASGLRIDPVMVQNMGIRTAKVIEGPLVRSVRAVGYLEEPETAQLDINLRVSGWIEKLQAGVEGMPISKGQTLFELYSPEMQVAVEELISARRSRESLPASADESTRRTVTTLYESAAQRLELWGLSRQQVEELSKLDRAPRTIAFRSPIDGHVTEKAVFEGSAVKAGDLVMRLSNRSVLWLDAQVFERDLPLVREGQKVTATVSADPGRVYEGTVQFVHPHLDATTRTALVRIEVPNESHVLRQGMYATVELSGVAVEKALLVPREAVIDTGVRQIAFVMKGSGEFEPRPVKMGLRADRGMVQILEGLAAGEMIVTSGQFLLDSETRLREGIEKHLHANLAHPPDRAPADAVAARGEHEPAAPSGPAWPQLDAVFAEYLKIADALGAKPQSATPVDPAALVAAAEAVVAAEPQLAEPAGNVASHARKLAGLTLEDQRKVFSPLGEAMLSLAGARPPSKLVAPRLYAMFCPMTPGGGGWWLQATDQIHNPFYAERMKNCGEIRQTIETTDTE
jgi:Cu(I)/Ag(I) efflux system membrane fusion protein